MSANKRDPPSLMPAQEDVRKECAAISQGIDTLLAPCDQTLVAPATASHELESAKPARHGQLQAVSADGDGTAAAGMVPAPHRSPVHQLAALVDGSAVGVEAPMAQLPATGTATVATPKRDGAAAAAREPPPKRGCPDGSVA